MIAVDELWTERFQRLRGVMNARPDRKLNPIQMRREGRTCRGAGCRSRSAEDRSERSPAVRGVAGAGSPLPVSSCCLALSQTNAVEERPASRRNRRRACGDRVEGSLAAADGPSVTPLQRSSLVIQPASRTTIEVVLRDRVRGEEDRVHVVVARGVELGGAGDLVDVLVRCTAGPRRRRRPCRGHGRPSRRRPSGSRGRRG